MSNASMEIIPSMDMGNPENQIHFINRFLAKHTKSNLSVLEIMIKDNGCKLVKPQNWIFSPSGSMIHPGQLFEAYNMLNQGYLRCCICNEVFDLNTILEHLQGTYQKGHSLTTEATIKLFGREFYSWNFHNNIWTHKGEDVSY